MTPNNELIERIRKQIELHRAGEALSGHKVSHAEFSVKDIEAVLSSLPEGVIDNDLGASVPDQALAVPVESSGLAPSGFDPSRVRLHDSRGLIRVVGQRWRKQYFSDSRGWSNYTWGNRTPERIGADLEAINPETATVAEVSEIMGQDGWVTETCDFCNRHVEQWFEIGEEPDYEARYINACLSCAEHIGAIAMETRRDETEDTGSVAKP